MLNLLTDALKGITRSANNIENVSETVAPCNRPFRLAAGSLLLLTTMKHSKSFCFMNSLLKLIGLAFVLYGLTGWDPLNLNRKMVKAH